MRSRRPRNPTRGPSTLHVHRCVGQSSHERGADARWPSVCLGSVNGQPLQLQSAAPTGMKKRVELRRLHAAEAIALHSGSIFPPLQVAPSFACSVASLNQSPGHQLSGCHGLRCGILTDYQLGWGRPSTWLARRACAPLCFNTLFPLGDRRMDTPSDEASFSKHAGHIHAHPMPRPIGWARWGCGAAPRERHELHATRTAANRPPNSSIPSRPFGYDQV